VARDHRKKPYTQSRMMCIQDGAALSGWILWSAWSREGSQYVWVTDINYDHLVEIKVGEGSRHLFSLSPKSHRSFWIREQSGWMLLIIVCSWTKDYSNNWLGLLILLLSFMWSRTRL
jgi:hypothetical protein